MQYLDSFSFLNLQFKQYGLRKFEVVNPKNYLEQGGRIKYISCNI